LPLDAALARRRMIGDFDSMRTRPVAAALAAASLSAALCFAAGPAMAEPRDPLESWNRRVHGFNGLVQARLLAPAARLYDANLPAWARHGIANAMSNLAEPVAAVSGLAAGDTDLALHAATRFGINTTLGLAGINDPATGLGYPRRSFGPADTLCSWGVPSGPYLVLPVLGPSTLRDAVARLGTAVAIGQTLGVDVTLSWGAGDGFLGYNGVRHELARIEETSLDPYAVIRSAYAQRRALTCPAPPDAPEAAETE
jgi:phospholipid-binding lipoprotein MlaA